MPQDMHDANIITLYTHKGDRSDCNGFCGILSIIGKAFARVVLNRSQTRADSVHREAPCGYTVGI